MLKIVYVDNIEILKIQIDLMWMIILFDKILFLLKIVIISIEDEYFDKY